ncbi:MAG: glycosyltransferase [Hyphomicrobium sp.]|nr:glycosyltransferase [Hyphomicrobium sp.]
MFLGEGQSRRLRKFARRARREILNVAIPPARSRTLDATDRVRVVGLLSSASGIGNSARLNAAALRSDGVAVEATNVAAYFSADDGLPFGPVQASAQASATCSIYHLNPPMLVRGFLASGLRRYYASYNIGYWAWELETVPPEWRRAIDYIDAILVPTRFCADAIAKVTRKPVLVVPHPVTQGHAGLVRRSANDGDKPFTVFGVFNFGSSFERKNPVALINAFKLAFGVQEPARLILKTSDGSRYPGDLDRLRRAIGDHPNIEVIDAVWSEAQMQQAFADADAYISLHRSEGFGLSIAEAIMQETPVVATAWSGNIDFCHPSATYLVDYKLVPFRDEHGDYSEITAARWAEASPEHASRLLRSIFERPADARANAIEARQYLETHLERRTYIAALEQLKSSSAVVAAADPKPQPTVAAADSQVQNR